MKKLWKTTLALFLISLLLGCAHTVEITDHTIKAGRMKVGSTYIAPVDGWFVSEEGMERLLRAIEYYHFKWLDCERKCNQDQ